MKINARTLKFALTILTLSFLIIFLHYTKILQPIEHVFGRVLSPVQRYFYSISSNINDWYQGRTDLDVLKRDVIDLESKLLENNINNSLIDTLKKENLDLKGLLDIPLDDGTKILVGSIIGKTIDGVQNTLLLNIGSDDGIYEGAPVIIKDKVIIGKIIKTSPKNSIVLLLTDNGSKLAGTIQNKDTTIGLVEGEHNINMIMNLIPQGELVYEGNIIITSGLERNIPHGLIIGSVNNLSTKSGDLFQTAIIKPMIDYHKVFIAGVMLLSDPQ